MSSPTGARSPRRAGARLGATAATLILVFATIQLVGASLAGAAAFGPAQLQPIVNNQVGGFEGLLAGGNPSVASDWTPGNLCAGNGTCYHELDNVPHRIFLKGLTSGTTYEFTILADTEKSGTPGYDNINTPTAISGVTGGSGGITLTQNPNTTTGCGQSTTCISYTFSFVASGTGAEIRFNVHLAIDSHLFNGSSLSARVLGTARNVPLPVKEILFQQVAASPDVKVEKRDDVTAGGVSSGGQFTYTVTATNLGGSVATDVNIKDTIPAGLTIVSASNGCTISGQDVTCALGNLAAGASASVTITVQATDGACPEVVNHATVTAGNEPAGNQGNNTSNDVTTLVNCVSPGVAVRIAKTNDADGDGHYTSSEEAKRSGLDVPFRLEIVNTGTVDTTITDLTDAFDQQTIDLLNTKCADLNGTTLAAGEAVVCKFTMNNYSPPAASGSLANTARICVANAAGDNTDCNVDDSSVRSAEVLGKTVTPTVTATPPGATAFTGSNGAIGFGLFALFLLMIGSGMTYLGYRRRARFDG